MSNRHIDFGNQTQDVAVVKTCIYRHDDPVKIIPLAIVYVERNDTARWTPPPENIGNTFTVKFFRPELGDRFLVGVDGVTWDQTVTVRGDVGSGYSVIVDGAALAEAV